jgi:tetratricopeptide (TPR) repeat protein
MNKLYLLTLFAALFIYGCKTASKAYEKGDYIDAIDLAIKKLQKDPNDGEMKAMLQNAYRFAVNGQQDKIRILTESTADTRFEKIYYEYLVLQHLYETINRFPTAALAVKPADYSGYVQTYRDKAADVHYSKGIEWMQSEDKKGYREAYQEFQKALQYKPQDIGLKRKRDEAYDAALIKVVVVPMDRAGNYYYTSNSFQMRQFQENIIRNLNYNTGGTLVRFYNEGEARSSNIQPDEIIEMRMGNLLIGQPYDENRTREVSKEVVVKEIVYKKDSVVKEYGKVTARITTTKRTLVSEGEIFVTSRDARGRILWSDNFRGEHRWQTEFATYQGDERALSDADKAILQQRDRNPPRQEDIIEEVLNRIQNEMTYKIRNYYQRYS